MSTENHERVWRLAALLNDAEKVMLGEADEIAARRPHPDAHLYDIEEGLRFHADHLEDSRGDVLTDDTAENEVNADR